MTTGLQIHVVLARLASRPRAISEVYTEPYNGRPAPAYPAMPDDAVILSHHHHPAVVATFDLDAVRALLERYDVTVALVPAIGERVGTEDPLLRLAGPDAAVVTLHHKLRHAIVFAPARTIDQDPAYAFRLIVDIAIKACPQPSTTPRRRRRRSTRSRTCSRSWATAW